MMYEYYKDDLFYIVESEPDRILSELEKWTKIKIEDYQIIKRDHGDAVFAERLVQDILVAGRDAVIGFWKYLYNLNIHFRLFYLPAMMEEINQTGDSLVEKILLDEHGYNLTPELRDIQDQHKKHLLEKTQHLVEHRLPGSTLEQQSFYIPELSENMIVVFSDDFRQRFEHELIETGRRQEDVMKKEQLWKKEHININKLFRWSHQKQCDPRVVMVSGVPGVGKTTMVQKFVYDWVTGKLYQRFAFVFFFKFRELNRLDKISLETMILQEYPHLQSHLENILQDPEKLLFIFDGLDESNHQMDFTPSQLCINPQWAESCGLVVVSLLHQSLLRGCSVLLTSRPTKLASVDTEMFHRVCEIMGFSSREIQMYFDNFFQNKELSEKAFHHVRENDTLYTFCYIPSYCSIICTVLSMCFKKQSTNSDQMSLLPKTMTQLFVMFISHILSNHSQDTNSQDTSRAKELMTSIGWMAEHGVMDNIIVFDERDLGSFNVNNSLHLMSSFFIESNQPPNVTFSFLHLTVQEFLAALVHYIDYSPEKLQRSLDKKESFTDGRGEMFLRFLCGFLDSSTRSLSKYLGDFPNKAQQHITNWLQNSVNIDENVDIETHLNMFYCLYESQNRILVEECLGLNRRFSLENIDYVSPVDCTVLAYIFKYCRETESLNVLFCNIQSEGWKRLSPILHTIKTIDLANTDLKVSCVKYITSALHHPDCRIQELVLLSCGITEESCPYLASAISNNQSLRTLDLAFNNLSGHHFSELMTALSSPTCQIEELRLFECELTEESCLQLAPVISNNQSLRTLYLSHNNLSGRHFSELMAALSSPTCQIQELQLEKCGVTEESCLQLASAISSNKSLRTLNLSHNNLSGRNFSELMAALSSPTCHIQKLHLLNCGITEKSCPLLASLISNNQSLRTLDLCDNNLSGRHFSELMTALSSPTCQIETLLLRECGITGRSCPQLASVISNNQSLSILNLSGNNLSGRHFSELMAALSTPTCLIQELHLGYIHLKEEEVPQLLSLSNNTNLTHLDLARNNFQNQGYITIRDLIQRSPSLTYIDICGNLWSETEKNDLRQIKRPEQNIMLI